MNNLVLKRIIIALTILYVLSPDLAPGPLDDIIIMVLGVAFSSVVGDEKKKS